MAGAPRTTMVTMIIGDLFIICCQHIALFERELGLIEEADAFRGPSQGRNHAL